MARWLLRMMIALTVAAGIVAAIGYREARQLPIVRRATIALPDWPAGAPPVRVALVADIHMASAVMDETRLTRIVDEVDALHPDLVVLAGDFIDGRGKKEAARALPILRRRLAALRPPLGSVAVLGNHDRWTDPQAVKKTLDGAGVTVLINQAVERGPLAIGGIDDSSTGHPDEKRTAEQMRRLPGARVMIAHSPDAAHELPADIHLLLAGHTHCGQVVLPLIGAPIDVADPRYRCGMVRDPGRVTIVTAGVGTSDLPLRIGAPPDLWFLTLEGSGRRSARQIVRGGDLDDRVNLDGGAER